MIYKETLEDGFTQGELLAMDDCMFRWNKRYNERLELEGYYKIPLLSGSAWHKFMETLYGSHGKDIIVPEIVPPPEAVLTDTDRHVFNQQNAMFRGMARAYIKKYTKEIETIKIKYIEEEIKYHHPFAGIEIPIQFKVDLLSVPGQLYDHKTTSMLRNDLLAKWDFKFQFMFYCWGIAKALGLKVVKEFTVNAIKKPQIRPKQGEPLLAYERRVEMVMLGDPQEYFYRMTHPVTVPWLSHFETEILNPKFVRIRTMKDIPNSLLWENRNTEACHSFGETCPFFPICAEGASTKGYIQLKKKHTHYDYI